jgi:hypothetical protein
MWGWSFSARTLDEVARTLGAMQKHRYIKEVDHRIHWSIDSALSPLGEPFGHYAASIRDQGVELDSRDSRCWRPVDADVLLTVLKQFWSSEAAAVAARLEPLLRGAGIKAVSHAPFQSAVDDAPFPDLLLLDWVFLPVDELDTERHAGALRAMDRAQEEVHASEPVYVEAFSLCEPELCNLSRNGGLPVDLMLWGDGPYSYIDYVFRGVSKMAKLDTPPLGYQDC